MAFVILTDPQKDLLQADAGFQTEVKWGILNKATFWVGLDGTANPVYPGGGILATHYARWAKSRHFSAAIGLSPGIAEQTSAIKYFTLQLKNVQCVDDTVIPFSTSQVVTKLLSLGQFDTCADAWFDQQIASTPF